MDEDAAFGTLQRAVAAACAETGVIESAIRFVYGQVFAIGAQACRLLDHSAARAAAERRFGRCSVELGDTLETAAREVPFERIASLYDKLLGSVAGERRSRAGAYYTPVVLAHHLVGSGAMIPNGTVCDPAVGTGGLLLAAARRLSGSLESKRELIRTRLYGADTDPLAVELCRASLWFEMAEPGLDLGFLDHRIRCGNALAGTTPELIAAGVPDTAFKLRPGDSAAVARHYRARNRRERRELGADLQFTPAADKKLLADAWCAAFVWRLHDTDAPGVVEGCPGLWDAITTSTLCSIAGDLDSVPAWMLDEIHRLAAEHRFFHWHLEFPEVFAL